MRIGLIGPTDDDESLREAASFLLGDADVEQVVYLGDGAYLERALTRWAHDLSIDGQSFFDRAAAAAHSMDERTIEDFLVKDSMSRKLVSIRRLPEAPARGIELIEDRVIVFVHDKAVLDEEDIANAHVVVYGAASESSLRKFGRRAFFTPGPLAAGRVGVLESTETGLSVALYDVSGMPILREALATAVTRMMVSS